MTTTTVPARRPLATRARNWPHQVAAWLAHSGVSPNAVSLASVGFAATAAGLFVVSGSTHGPGAAALLIAAAAAIQARLACNLLDGLLAVECGLATPTGPLYNELPDRVCDVLILVSAGAAARSLPGSMALGWLSAVLALLTAYVRALGASLGAPQAFDGPMAKPHRMAVVTVAAALTAVSAALDAAPHAMRAALVTVAAGSIVTIYRRTRRIAHHLGAHHD